jgi:hypothetical protein
MKRTAEEIGVANACVALDTDGRDFPDAESAFAACLENVVDTARGHGVSVIDAVNAYVAHYMPRRPGKPRH